MGPRSHWKLTWQPCCRPAADVVCFVSPRCYQGVAPCLWWEAICSHGRGESWILLLHSSFHYKEWTGNVLSWFWLGSAPSPCIAHFYFGWISAWGFCLSWTSEGEFWLKQLSYSWETKGFFLILLWFPVNSSSEGSVTVLFYSRDVTCRVGVVFVIGLIFVISSGNVREEKVWLNSRVGYKWGWGSVLRKESKLGLRGKAERRKTYPNLICTDNSKLELHWQLYNCNIPAWFNK